MASEQEHDETGERVLLVDLCGTLFHANTTWAFLRDLFATDQRFQAFDRRGMSIPGRALNKLLPGDRRRARAIGFLAGRSRQELLEKARLFVANLSVIDEVHSLVAALKKDHHRVVLLSSSIDVVVEAAAARLGIDRFEATLLGYQDGVCTGRIVRDLLGKKHEMIPGAFAGCSLTMISDNQTDQECVPLVDRFIAVVAADDEAARRFWSAKTGEMIPYRV